MLLSAEDVARIQAAPSSHYELLKQTPVSTVARIWTYLPLPSPSPSHAIASSPYSTANDHTHSHTNTSDHTSYDPDPQWIVSKSSTSNPKFARAPHDIVKELRLLKMMRHSNIIEVLGSFWGAGRDSDEEDEDEEWGEDSESDSDSEDEDGGEDKGGDDENEDHRFGFGFVGGTEPTLRRFGRRKRKRGRRRATQNAWSSPRLTLDAHTLHIYMPYIPLPLSSVLSSPPFSPHAFPSFDTDEPPSTTISTPFALLTRALLTQLLLALSYLHSDEVRIAHRDVKPDNVLITLEGVVKIVDFGVSYRDESTKGRGGKDAVKTRDGDEDVRTDDVMHEGGSLDEDDDLNDIFPEPSTRMYFEVCTGPYRPPELLFSPRTYDAFAVDMWSMGCVIAEFFRPLRFDCDEDEDDGWGYGHGKDEGAGDDGEDEEEEGKDLSPFIVPRQTHPTPNAAGHWIRTPLFDASRGEIGLAWSIFKVFGTPTHETWPDFEDLPGAKSVVFNVVPPVPLEGLLPNLPVEPPVPNLPQAAAIDTTPTAQAPSIRKATLTYQTSPAPMQKMPPSPTALDFLSRFLVYPPNERMRAHEALSHPWLSTGCVLLPRGYDVSGLGGYGVPQRTGLPVQNSESATFNGGEVGELARTLRDIVAYEWEGKDLGEWLGDVIGSS